MADKRSCIDLFDAIQKEVDERFFELPVDADGEVIRIGDRVKTTCNKRGKVASITYGEDNMGRGWVDVTVDYGDGRRTNYFSPEYLRHCSEPTTEELLCEFLVACEESGWKDTLTIAKRLGLVNG